MDGLRDPVGGRPTEVYWRRRIVAATGVALLLVVIFFLATSPGGTDKKPGASTTNSPAAVVSGDPTAVAVDGSTRACTAADVELTMTANPFSFAGGALPVFDVAIKNTGETPCKLDTAADGTEFVVWSGGESNKDVYFSTAFCPADGTIADRQLILSGGAEEPLSVTWSRERKGEGCTAGDAPADGFYWAQLTIQGIASEPAQFQLSA